MLPDKEAAKNLFKEGGIILTEAEENFINNVASGPNKDSFSQVVASLYSGKLLAGTATKLNLATWALVITSFGLIIATIFSYAGK